LICRITHHDACLRMLTKTLLAILASPVPDLGLVNGYPVGSTSNPGGRLISTRHKPLMLFKRASAEATYVGVICGVVGALALLSLGISLDLWRRRRQNLARRREEDQQPGDLSSYARFPRRPGDSPESENPPGQEHQSESPLMHTTLPVPASIAQPETVARPAP